VKTALVPVALFRACCFDALPENLVYGALMVVGKGMTSKQVVINYQHCLAHDMTCVGDHPALLHHLVAIRWKLEQVKFGSTERSKVMRDFKLCNHNKAKKQERQSAP